MKPGDRFLTSYGSSEPTVVELVKAGVFSSVVRYVDAWQSLPDTLPFWENGKLMPGRRVLLVNSELTAVSSS